MAFASSRIEAQEAIIKPCDLCEDEDDVNWFCVDCIQNLCERCKKGHHKIVTCRNHRLVPILEGVAIQKTNVSNLCQEHMEHFSFFCRTCEENICSICLSMVHKKHDFADLRNLHLELQRTLEKVIKEKEDEQMKITKNIEDLRECTILCRANQIRTYASIDDRMKAIYKAADAEGDKLKNHVKITTAKQVKELEERKQKLEGIKNEYEETIKIVKQELNLQTTPTYGQFVKSSTSKLHSLKPLTFPIPQVIRYTTGVTSKDLISDMILKTNGQMDMRKLDDNGTNGKIRIFLEFHIVQKHGMNTKMDCVSICTSPDGTIWVGGSENVYRMSSNCSKVLNKIPYRDSSPSPFYVPSFLDYFSVPSCRYIACLQSGEAIVYYSGLNDDHLMRITPEGRTTKICDLRFTNHFAVNNDNEVVVALHERNHLPISVVKYSKEGKQLNEIKLDKNAQIHGFCIDNDDNYVISEGSSSFLTILDSKGTVLKKIQMSIPGLYRMRCDRYGNILGLPRKIKNKTVYLISNDDGNVERLFTVECDETINDICIDRDNRLLILVDGHNVIVAEYLQRK